jgi:hypothetical protein
MNPDLIKQYLLTAVRWALAMFAGKIIGWIAATVGMPVDATTQAIASLIVAGAMFLWSLANKWHAETKINTALDLPKGTDKATLKEVIAEGNGTAATAKK